MVISSGVPIFYNFLDWYCEQFERLTCCEDSLSGEITEKVNFPELLAPAEGFATGFVISAILARASLLLARNDPLFWFCNKAMTINYQGKNSAILIFASLLNKVPNKSCSRRHINFFPFIFRRK